MKRVLIRSLVFWLAFGAGQLSAAEDQWQDVARIVAVGDVHGDYDHFLEVLRDAGIIDRRRNWIAGETHFVQMGDLPDRGPDTDKIIELMKNLEQQAAEDGGMVHPLIGNHEAMNIYGDLRYVHPGEYEALRSRQARRLRNDLYDRYVAQLLAADPEFVADKAHREQFDSQYPLGFVEHRSYWNAQGPFGSWVLPHNTVIKINRTLFVHGGIAPEVLGKTIREINEQVRAELQEFRQSDLALTESPTGPLWYRGLANNDEMLEQAHVDAVLEFYEVDRIVLGHTPGLGTIRPRFGSKVLIVDTGISEYYGAHLGSLLIEDGELLTVQRGEKIRIPVGDEAVLPYYEAIAELEPEANALRVLINTLEFSTNVSPPQQ